MASSAAIKAGGLKVRPRPNKEGAAAAMEKAPATSLEPKKKAMDAGKPLMNSKLKSLTVVSKSEVKGKTVTKTVTKTATSKATTVKVKTEKKVYTMTGQKHDPPEEREPLRIFYETLSKQIPSSKMAEIWLMEYGLLSPERAKKAYQRKQKKQHQLRTGIPIKTLKQERPESSKKPNVFKNGDSNAKKRVRYSDDEDDDFIVKHKTTKG